MKYFLDKLQIGEYIIYETSYIFYNEEKWILILHSEALYIFGEKWNDELLTEVATNFNLDEFTNFEIVGTTELISVFIDLHKVKNHEIIKERVFYKLTSISYPLITEKPLIRNAKCEEINDLALMLQEYYRDEYSGLNNKSIEEMTEKMFNLIKYKSIYVLIYGNDVVSFCTIIDPDIGILFTNEKYRGNGFGKHVLADSAEELLQKNGIVYLMTDKNKEASNNVVRNVGFKSFYDHIHLKFNCG